MRAFITGATGFLGRHLVELLVKEAEEITVLVRKTSNLETLKKFPQIKFAYGDILDPNSLKEAIPDEVDAVFHVAGSVAVLPEKLEHTRYDINVVGTKNVVEACLEKNIGKLIYTSTVVVFDWRHGERIDESFPKNRWCNDAYVRSKTLADDEVDKGVEKGLNAVYMHPSAVIGKYDRGGWASLFTEIKKGVPMNMAAPGGGSICSAREVMQAHIDAYHHAEPGSRYILGGFDRTWYEVMQKVAKLLGKKKLKKPTNRLIFLLCCYLDRFFSRVVGKEPTLTKHVQDIVSIEIYSDSRKAMEEIKYRVVALDTMLEECFTDLKSEKLV
ncbi:NAD-dependent epimerase/dehydratase family protein [Alteromonas sp. ASW11-130]|uniref:NAD-dependent epimerase/dehydratase family protein n=1 Tax=Alteromonas sp. ASW11-130 TaxID=3015775 RepID=UPI0022423AE9|nr:NAD-dependent epimerase/dehydratase family protein [Alteromonas sp. ASW11-130]